MTHTCSNGGQPFPHILLLLLTLLALVVPPSISEPNNTKYWDCLPPTPHPCGGRTYNVSFPFGSPARPDYCSYPGFRLACDEAASMLTIDMGGDKPYQVKGIYYSNQVLTVADPILAGNPCLPQTRTAPALNLSLFDYAADDLNLTLYLNCSLHVPNLTQIDCGPPRYSYYTREEKGDPAFLSELKGSCGSVGVVPTCEEAMGSLKTGAKFGDAMGEGFGVAWAVGKDWCGSCVASGGVCGYDAGSPDARTCFCPNATSPFGSCALLQRATQPITVRSNVNVKNILIGVGVGGAVLTAAFLMCLLWYQRKKRRKHSTSSNILIRTAPFDSSSTKYSELGGANFRTHIFSYDELENATNGFDATRELGDGGFGTVYEGKLRDGRTVAVKRLYENNYKRVEQFMNEVDILSRLRHRNLVTLYGCTSRHSRELLLVYEFVSNGTVADHLHGPRVVEGGLAWPIRMGIAIETADALAYLHAVEPQIIHRDVKSNNILLDDGFHVKVGDFGLSRLFPLDATHVSTLPQGTPGYVDPAYHQCYQLTDKSDVYSFGVVLVELISSKPAVDISRSWNEINLASLAINRIQSRELDQLVDPGLGYRSDGEKERMITLVAELAFRCLQGDREMRPPIKEVVEELRWIQSGGLKEEKGSEPDAPAMADAGLLKNVPPPFSPDSVAAPWESRSTTPNTSV